jgi:hypothetical protein
MNRLVFAIALITAGLFHHVAHAEADAPIECFLSPEAVQEAYPESPVFYTTHATWWTESSKCWFAGKADAKPQSKPHVNAAVARAPSQAMAKALPPQPKQPKQEAQAAHEEEGAVEGTYEENAAALRALMFDPDESPTDFEGRFSAVGYKAPK